MINPRELRIGNLIIKRINLGDYEHIVEIQTFKKIDNEEIVPLPIPITEEWLLRFGFINNDFLPSGSYYLNGFSIEFEENIITVFIKTLEIDIKYIHQLQNLYFALTGEELELK